MLKGSKDLSEWADPALSLEAALVGHRFKDSLAMEQTVLIDFTTKTVTDNVSVDFDKFVAAYSPLPV